MPKIKEDGKKKLENYKLQILLSEIGIFANLKTKKIKFNPKPLKEKKQKEELPAFIDLHLEISSKIDEVIKKHELQSISKEEPIENTTLTQIRKPWNRTPTRPIFKTETIQDNFEINDTLFEVERHPSFNQNIQTNNLTPLSNKVTFINEPLNIENIDFIKKIDEPQNVLTSLGRIKLNKNPIKTQTTTQKTNGVTFAKTDLEITKKELERKKQELEEMQRVAKEKEEELKKKEHEKKKEEKLRKEKQKELEKEKRIKEKHLLIEQKRQEKIKQIEEKKWLKERELKKKQKEKEEIQKQKLIEKQEKIKQLEEKNIDHENKSKVKTEVKFDLFPLKKKKPKPEIKTQKPTTIASEETKNEEEKTTIDLLDEEVGQALEIIDNLLEKLPEETIDEFVQSNDFEIYERVVNKYKKK